ncbi:Hypothetical_protein [Hexamita inflata]|uniref:Hypothetical_protein n=1 Tax=Hexamita inflata TaxID=28002 RepID=A0AA86U9Z1_9EUKA|nr:Hypothetical protein HINF_LOCUS34679 [Hexamita inflata]
MNKRRQRNLGPNQRNERAIARIILQSLNHLLLRSILTKNGQLQLKLSTKLVDITNGPSSCASYMHHKLLVYHIRLDKRGQLRHKQQIHTTGHFNFFVRIVAPCGTPSCASRASIPLCQVQTVTKTWKWNAGSKTCECSA